MGPTLVLKHQALKQIVSTNLLVRCPTQRLPNSADQTHGIQLEPNIQLGKPSCTMKRISIEEYECRSGWYVAKNYAVALS